MSNHLVEDAGYVRLVHLKNNEGSLYFNDLDPEENKRQAEKIAVYLPYGETIDLPLTSQVALAYIRGSIRKYAQKNLLRATIFNERSVELITQTTTNVLGEGTEVVLVDTSQGDVSLNLPPLDSASGISRITIKKITNDANVFTLGTSGSDPIEPSPSNLDEPYSAVTIIAEDGAWHYESAYPAGDVTGGGGGTGTAGRRDYSFAANIAVPKNSGILYLFNDEVASSNVPLLINRDCELSGASVRLEEVDPTQDYELRVLVNGTLQETLAIPANTLKVSDTSFTSSVAADSEISILIVRTSGNEKSEFSNLRATIELTEV